MKTNHVLMFRINVHQYSLLENKPFNTRRDRREVSHSCFYEAEEEGEGEEGLLVVYSRACLTTIVHHECLEHAFRAMTLHLLTVGFAMGIHAGC